MVSKLPIIWKQTVARETGEEVSESDGESQEVVEMRGRSRLAHEERGDLVKKGMEIPSVTTEEFESWWNARTEAKRLRARSKTSRRQQWMLRKKGTKGKQRSQKEIPGEGDAWAAGAGRRGDGGMAARVQTLARRFLRMQRCRGKKRSKVEALYSDAGVAAVEANEAVGKLLQP